MRRRSQTSPTTRRRWAGRASLALTVALLAGAPSRVLAQQTNPVYVDDSIAAAEAIARSIELSASGNHAEASRVLQRVLDEDAERLLPVEGRPSLFRPVRDVVHETLLARPALLEEYRALEAVEAQRLLRENTAPTDERVERSRLLTTPGFDAALRVAQRRVERAQFWSALRVLASLERHPDLEGDRLERALALASRAAEYLRAQGEDEDAGGAAAVVEALASAGGVPAPTLHHRSLPPTQPATTPFDNAGEISIDAMLSKPLWSTPIVSNPDAVAAVRDTAPSSPEAPHAWAVSLSVMPTATDDTIYINAGDMIAAFDRYTLAPRWPERRYDSAGIPQARIVPGRRGARAVTFDDTTSVAVAGPWLIAVTGSSTSGRRLGDPRVHALDTQTGRTAWAVDIATLDPALEGASVRGKPLVHAGVVVLTASRQQAQRRLESVLLVGLDLASGALLWRTPLASAGALPYNSGASAADTAVVWRGLALRADELGAVGAVDIASGRPVWVRKSERASLSRRDSWPYEAHAPVVVNGRAYVVAPDGLRIAELDAATGDLLRDFDTREIGAPRYLVATGDRLFSVSELSVVALNIPDIDDARAPNAGPRPLDGRILYTAGKPGIRGRVVPAEDALVIPLRDGVAVARLDETDAGGRPRVERINLDRPGVVLPLRDQLIVVDDIEVHTYLLWETAERQLLRRIEGDTSDPTAAVVYAELAYRAGKPQTVLPAVRLAQRAIERGPASPLTRASRERLFSSIVSMLKPERPSDTTALPRDVRAGLVESLESLAARTDERATALLLRGEHAQAFTGPEQAVAAYQAVLDDPNLASAQLQGVGVVRSASDEATRRLRTIVREHGQAVYGAYEAEAAGSLARLGVWSDAEAFEDLARRYPVAPSAARAWMLAAEAHERAGQLERAAAALETAFVAARDALVNDRAMLGELTGRLVTLLQRSGRPGAAGQALARALSEFGEDLPVSAQREPLDLASLRASLSSAASEANRRPRVGDIDPDATPQPLLDWVIVDPLVQRDAPPARSHAILASNSEYALFSLTSEGPLAKRWTLPRTQADALVRLDERAAYFTADRPGGRVLMRLDTATGMQTWASQPFRAVFGDGAGERDPRLTVGPDLRGTYSIDVPLAGRRQIFELLVAFDERSFVMVERSGRAAAFDTATGALLWAREDLPAEVYDIAAKAGVLVVGGANAPRRVDDNASRAPTLVTIDLRTGQPIHEARPDAGRVRWVRPAGPGSVLVGFDSGVASYDPFRGEQRWLNTNAALRDSVEAWAFDDRLIVLDPNDQLWQVSQEDGALRPEPLNAESRLRRDEPVRVASVNGLAAFATRQGLIVFGPGGEVVGKDASIGGDSSVLSAFVDGRLLTIEQTSVDRQGDLDVHRVRQFDSSNGALRSAQRVLLGASPVAISALDGVILISAGQMTIAYPAPPAR